MTYEDLLRQLGASLDLSALAARQPDECELLIDGMAVRLRHLREARQLEVEADLHATSPLGWDAAAAMLAANFVGDGAPDAVCQLGPDGVARLSMRHALESLSGEAFANALERFVARLERHLQSAVAKPPAPAGLLQWQAV